MKSIRFALSCLGLILLVFSAYAQDGSAGFLSDLISVKKGRARAVTSSDPDFNSNYDRRTYVKPGETMVLCDIEGPAIINHIWLTFNDARPNWLEEFGSARPDEIVLRMFWDDGEHPAVEAPLGDFFGAGFGLRREIRSMPILVEGGDGYNCYWQMPFFKRGKITVTNEGSKNVRSFYYHIDYTEYDELPEDTAFFCAQYRQEFPESPGKDYLILDAEGRGHYVGTVMSVRSRSPFWFGEGDARIGPGGDGRRHARHHAEGAPGGREGVGLLAPAAEDQRVAALQPDDELALAALGHEQLVDLRLGHGVGVGSFADVDQLGVGAAARQQGGVRQPVVTHHVGAA